jgi:Arm DNA-binding domain
VPPSRRKSPISCATGGGSIYFITPAGARLWRLRFRLGGRESMVSLGAYPDVGLKLARERRDDARKAIAAGIDPVAQRRAKRAGQENTFQAVALEWLAKQRFEVTTRKKAEWTFNQLLFPRLGSRTIASITAPEVLAVLGRMEVQGKHETAHRAKQRVSQVLRYAIATGRAQHDVTADLRGALAPVKTEHFAAITEPKRVGELLRAIDGYNGPSVVAWACSRWRITPIIALFKRRSIRQVRVVRAVHGEGISPTAKSAADWMIGGTGDERRGQSGMQFKVVSAQGAVPRGS